MVDQKLLIEAMVKSTLGIETQIKQVEDELMQNDKFRKYIELKKDFEEQDKTIWDDIKEKMIAKGIRSIKGDWGSLTIAEKLGWDVDMKELSPRFIKKVPDTTLLSSTYRLENKTPKGATPKFSKYLTKHFK